ncbi:MAG: fluoride efflux transporter CrcB [Acidobacteria bacterium]|nr:fluoride efflux transporter CrcB [Acidobacteriota bacterium]
MRTWLVFLGGGLGSLARYALGIGLGRWSQHFPLGTFAINVGGSFLLGLLFGITYAREFRHERELSLFLGSGFLGGFTTFSTFELEGYSLLAAGHPGAALLYTVGSVAAGLAAAALGAWLGHRL